MFFNIPIPDIFNLGDSFKQNYQSHHERVIDSRNIVLLEPLTQSLQKLEDIRLRIGTRIEKETASGTDMTIPIDILHFADQTISTAEIAVANATSTISSDNPHPAYMETQQAYEAINQARDSLSNVVDAIIIASEQASSTPPKALHEKNRK